MRKISILTLSVLLIISFYAYTTQGQRDTSQSSLIQRERHLSKEAGYSILFPERWEVMRGLMGSDIIALAPTDDPEDLFRENANIIYTKFEFPISKEEYYSHNIRSLHELLTDFDLEGSENVKLDGVDVKKIRFTHRIGVVNAIVIQYLILDNGKAYVMSFTADPIDFPKIKGQFETIAKTFRFE